MTKDSKTQQRVDYVKALVGGNVSEVSKVAETLRKSGGDVERDQRVVAKAIDHTQRHDRLSDTQLDYETARRRRDEIRKRCVDEISAAVSDCNRAAGEVKAAKKAAGELHRLAKANPELFTGGSPPRLVYEPSPDRSPVD